MMMRLRLPLVLALAAAATACGILDPNSDVENKLNDEYAKWLAKGPATYEYRLTQICFCAPDYTKTFLVRVSNGTVVDTRDATTGAPPPAQYQSRTVPDLFAVIHDAIGRDADQIDVDYDPELGYPTRIAVDYVKQAADEEIELRAEGLAAPAP
jgi:hypothetical protein